jgi:Zn finger protein HypA/HybF involved in hydrogenase expression
MRTYYCRDCQDDWSTNEEETWCTQCLGDNIKET